MSTPLRVAFVVAVADNGVIGRDGQLPWRMSTDLKRFRALTLGKPVVMGRKTYESIGKPLDGRDTIIVSRRPGYAAPAPGVHVATGIEAALALGRTLAAGRGADEVMVIGGAEVFAAAMPYADRIYLTRIHASPPGDVTWSPLEPAAWVETFRETLPQGEKDQFPADFVVLDRTR